jgi:hypothetical protein
MGSRLLETGSSRPSKPHEQGRHVFSSKPAMTTPTAGQTIRPPPSPPYPPPIAGNYPKPAHPLPTDEENTKP